MSDQKLAGVRVVLHDSGSLAVLDFPAATRWADSDNYGAVDVFDDTDLLASFSQYVGVLFIDALPDEGDDA